MTNRPPEIDKILARRLARPQPQQPSSDLVPVPDYLLRDTAPTAPERQPDAVDLHQAAQILSVLFGGAAQQPPQQLRQAANHLQIEGSQAGTQPGGAGSESSEATSQTQSLRERATNFYRSHRVARYIGLTVISAVAVTGAYKGFALATGETIPQYALTKINSGKQVLGIGNTYDLVMNSADCATPIATVEVESAATMTIRANKATDPADVIKNRKDSKHAVPTEEVEITPLPIAGNPFTGDKTALERDPQIKFRDTLGVLVCSEGGVNISGLTAEVDPSKLGFRLASTSGLGEAIPGLVPNEKRVDMYEPIAIGQEPKGKQPLFSDGERKAINSLMGNGKNPAVTRAFRQNITLRNVDRQCGPDIQAKAKAYVQEYLQQQFAQQVSAITDPSIKEALTGKALAVTWKDGEAFKSLETEYILSQEGQSYAVPDRITFERTATTCAVTSLEEKK